MGFNWGEFMLIDLYVLWFNIENFRIFAFLLFARSQFEQIIKRYSKQTKKRALAKFFFFVSRAPPCSISLSLSLSPVLFLCLLRSLSLVLFLSLSLIFYMSRSLAYSFILFLFAQLISIFQ